LLSATAVCPPAHAATWKGYTYINTTQQPAWKAIDELSHKIEEISGGKITIKNSLGGSLPIRVNEITQAVGDGILQFADDMSYVGNIPMSGVIRLPFLINSEKEYNIARKIWVRYMSQELAAHGVVLLAEYHYPPQVFFATKPLKDLQGVKGLKIRVSSAEQGEFIKKIGGVPITLSVPEVAPALQTGVVDGVLTASIGGGTIWKDVLKSRFGLGVNWTNSIFIVNKGTWDALPSDTQSKILHAARSVAGNVETEMMANEKAATEKLHAEGMTLSEPTPEQTASSTSVMRDYWQAWAKSKGPTAEKALSEILAALKK